MFITVNCYMVDTYYDEDSDLHVQVDLSKLGTPVFEERTINVSHIIYYCDYEEELDEGGSVVTGTTIITTTGEMQCKEFKGDVRRKIKEAQANYILS